MKKFVWTSDSHIGLITDDIDRTDEIISVLLSIVRYAVKIKADGFIFGGDIFDKNNPSTYLKTKFFKVLNVLYVAGIKTWIMDGNHDKISDPKKMSCLQFFEEITEAYKNVRWISDITCVRAFKSPELGSCYFTFLPHVSWAQIDHKKYKSAQHYIDKKCRRIEKKLPANIQHYVFSHLNVRGAIPGTEQFMLKRSEVWLPDTFTTNQGLKNLPEIIQAHIHTRQKKDNVNIIGSPICTHFDGGSEKKYFLELQIPEYIGEGAGGLIYHRTKCRPMIAIDFEIDVNDPSDKFLKKMEKQLVNANEESIFKINVTCPEEAREFDWEGFRKDMMELVYYVKPIKPRFIRSRVKRNKKQIVSLNPQTAVDIWLGKNLPRKKKRRKHLAKLAEKYIGGVIVRIGSLELHNFLVYRKFKRNFGDKSVVGFLGPNLSGKSAIIEAMLYNLTGESRANTEVELIHHGQDEMWTKMTIIDGKIKYVITRGRDRANKGLLEVKGIDNKKDAQQFIDKLIGMIGDELILTSFFKQSDINQFMELKPAKKKDYFVRWLKNTHWQKLEDAVSLDAKKLNSKLTDWWSKVAAYKSQIVTDKKLLKQFLPMTNRLVIARKKKKKILKRIKSLRVSPGEASRLYIEIKDIREEMDELFAGHDIKKLRKVDISKDRQLRKKRERLSIKTSQLDQWIKNAKKMTGTCPIIHESCDRISCSKETIHEVKEARQKFSVMNKKIYAEQETIQTAKHLGRYDKLKERYSKLRDRYKLYNSDQAKKWDKKVQAAEEEIEAATEKLGQIKNAKNAKKRTLASIKKLSEKIKWGEKKLGNLNYLGFMFGKNGIPSQEIENAFDQIEEEINYVLAKFGTDLEVQFKADRELSGWEDQCVKCQWQFPKSTRSKNCEQCGFGRQRKRRDELQLRVLKGGADESFHMESGGGKTIISIATRIALTRFLQRQTGSNFNVLFLDEPDAAFDELNRDKFMKLITRTLIQKLGFEQVFWISHFKDIQESIPAVLLVEKKGTYSQTRWL